MAITGAESNSASGRWFDVARVLAERSPRLSRKLTPVGVSLLRLIVHERGINTAAAWSSGLTPGAFVDAVLRSLGISVRARGVEHLTCARRPVVCANHPSGAVEGLALISVLCQHLGTCRVPANDLLCALEPLRSIIVPVRHGALSRNSASAFATAFAGHDPLLVFPAGVTARERGGRLRESPWRASFLTRARAAGRDLLPAAVSGRNSILFYAIHKVRRLFGISLNIEMALLVHEMFRRRGETVVVQFLPPRAVGGRGSASREEDRRQAAALQGEVERVAESIPTQRRRSWSDNPRMHTGAESLAS